MTDLSPAGAVLGALAVGLAAATGAGLRFLAERRWGPHGVLAANTAASALAGLAGAVAGGATASEAGLVVLGAFTLALGTFSTVAADAAGELLDGRRGAAVRRWAVHLGCGVAAATLGWVAGAVVVG